ncbi:MAG: hypothetical protein ABIG69_10900, partial [Bacteroidota bacterium]
MKKLFCLSVIVFLMLVVMPVVLAVDQEFVINTSTIGPGNTEPDVHMMGRYLDIGIDIDGSGSSINPSDIRNGFYAFMGEKIYYLVLVRDQDGAIDINTVRWTRNGVDETSMCGDPLSVHTEGEFACEDLPSIITDAANRLVALQNTGDGGWDWIVTDLTSGAGSTADNINGVTAQGLLNAYELTGDSSYLDAAKKAGDYLKNYFGIPGSIDISKRINAFDIVFLYNLGQVSGDISYTAEADALLGDTLTDDNYWAHNYGSFCDGSGCTAQDMFDAISNRRGGNIGIMLWDLSPWVKAAQLGGKFSWANDLKTIMNSEYSSLNSGPTYIIGLSGLILATGNANAISDLLSEQDLDGSWDGWIQDTAYALMALKSVGETEAVESAASYLVSHFEYGSNIDGWKEFDGIEYSEVTSEAMQALSESYAQCSAGAYVNFNGKKVYINSATNLLYDDQIDLVYLCVVEVESSWNEDDKIAVNATDRTGAEGQTLEELWDFNPALTVDVRTSDNNPLTFGTKLLDQNTPGVTSPNCIQELNGGLEDLDPNNGRDCTKYFDLPDGKKLCDVSFSTNKIIIENKGIVDLWPFIATTDFHNSQGMAICPFDNTLSANQFEYRAIQGSWDSGWRVMPEYASNMACNGPTIGDSCRGACRITEGCPINILGPSQNIQMQLKIVWPTPCIGSFNEGSIYAI